MSISHPRLSLKPVEPTKAIRLRLWLLQRLIQPLRYVFGNVICDAQAIGIATLALPYLFGKYGCPMGVLQTDIEGKRSCTKDESQWPSGRAKRSIAFLEVLHGNSQCQCRTSGACGTVTGSKKCVSWLSGLELFDELFVEQHSILGW